MGKEVNNSRTKNSIINIFTSVLTQIAGLIIKFVSRTIFIRVLGVELLGINGLFTNILTLLSLAELGLGSAVIYSMYKPVKENDTSKISALMHYYKKIYRMIILAILVVGLSLIPFLNNIVNLEYEVNNLYLIYILFLCDTVASYCFCYKSSIINANQKMYILKISNIVTLLIQFVLQIVVLIFTKDFVLYLIVQVLCTLLNNIIISLVSNKMYPYINDKVELDKNEKRNIFNNVKSLFVYKISGTILNNTDNIFISVLIGTTIVGYYSNYYMIVSAINGIIYLIFNALTASVGNLMTGDDLKKKNDVFMQLNLICFFITGFCTIELITLIDDFIVLWIGKQYLLPFPVVIVTILNSYIYNMQNPIWVYRDTTGLFKDAKNATIVLMLSNIILSYILGKLFGLFGILLATAISRLIITSWQQPYVLYKKVLNSSPVKYYLKKLYYISIVSITTIFVLILTRNILIHGISGLILKTIISSLTVILILILSTFYFKEFKQVISRFKTKK